MGQMSPPKFSVVDTSQEYLSVCFSSSAPFSYNLVYEYVGDNFEKEARAIHFGDSPERSIYGKTTLKEAKSLYEDGIPITPLPWVDRKTN